MEDDRQYEVRVFMERCDQPVAFEPTLPDRDSMATAYMLIREEYRELMKAIEDGDLVAIAQEAADLHYVICGLENRCGIDGGLVHAEVHRCNMNKLAGGLDENGKVRKPPGFVGPNVRRVLIEQGMEAGA